MIAIDSCPTSAFWFVVICVDLLQSRIKLDRYEATKKISNRFFVEKL